jgi:hypothetical protein
LLSKGLMMRMLGELNETNEGPPLFKEIVTGSSSLSVVFGSIYEICYPALVLYDTGTEKNVGY